MTADESLARSAAMAAQQLDLETLSRVLDTVRQAPDSREALQRLGREYPNSVVTRVDKLIRNENYTAALLALEAAVLTRRALAETFGEATLVWSGPTSRALRARPTREVVTEMIRRSSSSLTLVTFASSDIRDLVSDMNEARLNRNVTVRLIVETRDDALLRDGPDPISAFGNAAKAINAYRWPREHRGPKGASMHIKCVIQDRLAALISSANLSSPALDRNMELGLEVQGGDAPERLEQHFDDLIQAGQLVPIGS